MEKKVKKINIEFWAEEFYNEKKLLCVNNLTHKEEIQLWLWFISSLEKSYEDGWNECLKNKKIWKRENY